MTQNQSNPINQRVVVTGVGPVTSLGHGKDAFWSNLISGKSGISNIDAFDTADIPSKNGGQIKDFVPELFLSTEMTQKIGRASQLAVAAAKLALVDSGINTFDYENSHSAVIVGTTMSESQAIEAIDQVWVERGEEGINNMWISQYPGNSIAINVAREIGSTGMAVVIPTACAAGNYAIGYGFDLIKAGKYPRVLVGGADAFSRIAYVGFNRMFAMAPERCSPFDENRAGMLLGEGAGFMVLESERTAVLRNAKIYAEISGYALSCDASHMTIPSVDGLTDVINKALRYSNKQISDVDYISAHGTGTKMNDKVESAAINRVFGKLTLQTPVSSIKSMLGHTMGAASSLEAIACCLAIDNSIIPPTINFTSPDPSCNIDCVPNRARTAKISVAMNNSFAFGGNNACVIFSRN